MRILQGIEPQAVMRYFEEICAIPHGSGNTSAIADYCVAFAVHHGLWHSQDAHNNVIIKKPAAPGYESAAPVLLQGHLDMVCEKAADCRKDMRVEGLDLAVEGDDIFARGTTLGGDDGIAVAMILALLEDTDLSAPALECLITADEEIGMLGAAALEASPLAARRMINLDSEEEGIFTVSCAGGNRTCCRLPLCRETITGMGAVVTIAGLTGGHSGVEIDKGRANASMLMGRLLSDWRTTQGIRLAEAAGGLQDNAIPTECTALLVASDLSALRTAAEGWQAAFRQEYAPAEPDLTITVTQSEGKEYQVLTEESACRFLTLLCCAPNGVQAMSGTLPGLVQTSLNLGILKTNGDAAELHFCLRSSIGSQKVMMQERLRLLTEALGGSISIMGDYPAWEYRADSPLRDTMTEVYREQYGTEPKVEAIHAGLECGILSGKLPGLDCVSVGPNIAEIHTPRERLSISSTARSWRFLREVLRRLR